MIDVAPSQLAFLFFLVKVTPRSISISVSSVYSRIVFTAAAVAAAHCGGDCNTVEMLFIHQCNPVVLPFFFFSLAYVFFWLPHLKFQVKLLFFLETKFCASFFSCWKIWSIFHCKFFVNKATSYCSRISAAAAAAYSFNRQFIYAKLNLKFSVSWESINVLFFL